MKFRDIDIYVIHLFRRLWIPVSKFAIFLTFFWFGILKVVGLSPASPMVQHLTSITMPFIQTYQFVVLLGLFECVLGILFLIKGFERIVIPLLLVHMVTTFLPLFLLPHEVWQSFLVPTLEGQFIIKNIVIVAVAIGIASHLHPIPKHLASKLEM